MACFPRLVTTIVRYLTFVTVMTGCGFVSPPQSPPEVIPPATTPPAAEPCRTDEPGVVLCVDFEDRPLMNQAVDRSPKAANATAVEVGTMMRTPGEQAAVLTDRSSLTLPEASKLDLATFTIEMWIWPNFSTLKYKDHDAGLFHNYGQYAMRIQDDRRIICGLLGDQRVTSDQAVPLREWSHVTCRYAQGEMSVYLNGKLSGASSISSIPLLDLFGSAIGSELRRTPTLTAEVVDRFIGGIDNVRIYDRALDPDRICLAAGHTSPAECQEE